MRAPADRHASSTARFSTPVTPEGTQTTTRGCAQRFWWTFWMKCRSISSVTSKSAITPSLRGRIAWIVPGRATEHPLGLDADRVDFAGARVDRDDARLRQHDAAAADVDERVGRSQVDRHVAAAEPGQVAEEAHEWREMRTGAGGRHAGAASGRSVAEGSAGSAENLWIARDPAVRQRQADDVCSPPRSPAPARLPGLDRVAAGAPAPLLGGHVPVDQLCVERAKRDLRRGHGRAVVQDDPADHLVRAPPSA